MSAVSAGYRGLLAEPVLRRLAIADACARLPQGMVSITLLVAAERRRSRRRFPLRSPGLRRLMLAGALANAALSAGPVR